MILGDKKKQKNNTHTKENRTTKASHKLATDNILLQILARNHLFFFKKYCP
jgi:hypothetical protein